MQSQLYICTFVLIESTSNIYSLRLPLDKVDVSSVDCTPGPCDAVCTLVPLLLCCKRVEVEGMPRRDDMGIPTVSTHVSGGNTSGAGDSGSD